MTATNYYRQGKEKYQQSKYHEAITAFKQSLYLQENWQSYQGLGFAYSNIKNYKKSIDAFNRSLSLKRDWLSYQGLGTALSKTGHYDLAITNFKKSIEIKEDAKTFSGLAYCLKQLGKFKEACNAAQKYYRHNNYLGHVSVDPFLSLKNCTPTTRDHIEHVKSILSKDLFSFHPSFCSEGNIDKRIERWRHLIHIHVPKSAGTNFERPLARLVPELIAKSNSLRTEQCKIQKHYLWTGNIKQRYLAEGYLLEASREDKVEHLQGSLFVDHGGGSGVSNYFKTPSQSGIDARKIYLVRDPSERLYSHIKHFGFVANDKENLRKICIERTSNLMHEYISRHSMSGDENKKDSSHRHGKEVDSIDFIDISNDDLISKIKSSFLSATMLPNIVQYNRLNNYNKKKTGSAMFDERDIQDIFQELTSLGYLDLDLQIDLELLKQRSKERLKFPDLIHTSTSLHPITYIFPKSGNPRLMRTKDFLANPLGAINY